MVDRDHGAPDRRRVATFAHVRCLHVLYVFARGIDAVMAAEAIVDDIHVVEIGGNPGDRRVAVITVVATTDVGRVLAHCRGTVVTGDAGADYLHVIDDVDGQPRHIVVTVFANVRRLNMADALAGSVHSVVAAEAVVDDIGVIESSRNPGRRGVTIVAIVATVDMVGILARGNRAVVARTAGSQYLRVVDEVSRCP